LTLGVATAWRLPSLVALTDDESEQKHRHMTTHVGARRLGWLRAARPPSADAHDYRPALDGIRAVAVLAVVARAKREGISFDRGRA
jgi:hypothetical protein